MTKQNKTQVETMNIFGYEIENKKLNTQELVDLVKKNFETLETVGHVSYFILALKHLGLVSDSYSVITAIIIKIFELNGQQTNTTEKCMAWYMQKIKKEQINIYEPFKVGRKKQDTNLVLSNIKF